jgi:hypothetical protein
MERPEYASDLVSSDNTRQRTANILISFASRRSQQLAIDHTALIRRIAIDPRSVRPHWPVLPIAAAHPYLWAKRATDRMLTVA